MKSTVFAAFMLALSAVPANAEDAMNDDDRHGTGHGSDHGTGHHEEHGKSHDKAHGDHGAGHGAHGAMPAIHHDPIGVMGSHLTEPGKVMVSLRYQRMQMEGSRIGTDPVSPETIATTVPNRFFGQPMQPPTLRVVPLDMSMDMIMAGAMVGVTDWLTLMAMGMFVEKSMDHVTFQGPTGTTELGNFTTGASDFGDTTVTALARIFDVKTAGGAHHKALLNLGASLPTGSIVETDAVLTPLNMTPTLRLPYPMQLGSGTFDLQPGFTYTGMHDSVKWGAQYKATVRLGNNDQGYTFGDAQYLTAWGQYATSDLIAFSLRGAFTAQNAIEDSDASIVAPVQTANPDFQGGDRLDVGVGFNLNPQSGALRGHGFGVEMLFPVYQDLNGPQLETDWTLTIGWHTVL
ncbi:MAG: transporter [Pseudomonadota bacterium]